MGRIIVLAGNICSYILMNIAIGLTGGFGRKSYLIGLYLRV